MTVMRVTSIEYETENGEVIVKLAGRSINDKRRNHKVRGTEPWMFAPAEESVPDEDYIVDVEHGYESFDGKPAKKVVTRLPKQAGDLKDEFSETWEADIPYYRRVSMFDDLSGYIDVPDKSEVHIDDIDTDVDPSSVENIEPRVVIGDIEVIPDTSKSIQEMVEEGSQPITNITVYDNYDDEYTAFILDPNDDVEFSAQEVKDTLLEHWGGGQQVGRWVYDEEKMAYTQTDEVEVDPHTNGDINLEVCATETTLAKRFIAYIKRVQPDLISGWNWVDFDHEYLLRRFFNLDDEDGTIDIHALSDIGFVSRRKLSNPNHKDRAIECLPGFDMMDAYCGKMSRGEWRSQALDYVAEEELEVGKVAGVSVFDAFNENRSLLAAYNIIDVQLCVELDEKHGVHDFFLQLSELSQIQISDAFREMRMVDGFIMSRRDDDELLPSSEEKDLEDNAGGLVLSPYNGISEWVGVVDLKSLYPSAIITWNISTETIDWKEGPWQAAGSPDLDIPWVPEPEDVEGDIEPEDISWDQMASTLDQEGIIPKYLRMLFEVRAEYKEVRNQYDVGSDEYEVWDNRQRAVKIVMNSFYGVSSNDYWRLAREGMGDAITSAARYTLWQGIQITEEEGYEVLYGDSVPADEPVLIRDDTGIDYVPISSLEGCAGEVEVWSDEGFVEVEEVIKKPNRKQMYRTRTKHGIVSTTEDHALLTSEAEEVKPEDVELSDELLHSDYSGVQAATDADVSVQEAWLLGLFVADGSAYKDGNDTFWAINNSEHELLERASDYLESEFGVDSHILEVTESSGTDRLTTIDCDYGQKAKIIEEFKSRCYSGKKKRIPRCIINGDEAAVEAFLDGYHEGDGYVGGRYTKRWQESQTDSKVLAAGLAYLYRKLGYEFRVNYEQRDADHCYYRVNCQDGHHGHPEKVKKQTEVEYDGDYVYDLQTENGHFNSGIGTMTVHNTDSVMVSLADAGAEPADIAPTFEVSDELRQTYPDAEEANLRRHAAVTQAGFNLEETINDNMHRAVVNSGMDENGTHPFLVGRDLHGTDQHCLSFEFEKLYRRFIQAGSKKRYAGLEVWEEGQWLDEPESDVTGFESRRSSSPIITSLVQPGTIKLILQGSDFDEVSGYIQRMVGAIKNQELPLHHVAEPKSFGKPSLDDYGTTSPALRAVEHSNEYLDKNWSASDSVWMYHVDRTPAMRGTDVIALDWNEDLPDGYSLDVEKIVDKAIKAPLDPILDVAGYDFTELKAGGQSADALNGDDWGVEVEATSSDDSEDDSDDDWGVEPDDDDDEAEEAGGALEW